MIEGDSPDLPKRKVEDYYQRWEYQAHFKEYLLLLGKKGKEALERIDSYPRGIELDASWHRVLDSMRDETKNDSNERFAIVGYRETARDFYFPKITGVGEPYTVPPEVINEMIHAAKEKEGVTSILGDIHSHNYVGPLTFMDFYGILQKHKSDSRFMSGLVNPHENIIAFKTRQTYNVSDFGIPNYDSKEGFKNYWMRKAGFKSSPKHHHIARFRPSADMYAANIAIAQTHRLALYRGSPGQDLIRMYP
jgi:hypothetical protein